MGFVGGYRCFSERSNDKSSLSTGCKSVSWEFQVDRADHGQVLVGDKVKVRDEDTS